MTQRLITFDNSQIESMLRTPAIVREFPFMSGLAAKLNTTGKGCGSCGKKTRTNVLDYEGIKTAIGQMPTERKDKLLQLLDTQKFRVNYRNQRGQTVRLTHP